MRILTLAAASAVIALAGTAVAQSGSSLTLRDAASAPSQTVIIDGASWRCDAQGACVATGQGAEQPALRACRRVAARLGAVSAFTWRGVTLGEDQIAACNTAAR